MSRTSHASTAATAQEQKTDIVESAIRQIDEASKRGTGVSLMHLLTLGSIGASIALFLSGKKDTAIFVGLWAPTFEALRSASERDR